jgi:site-specific recombinase XerD
MRKPCSWRADKPISDFAAPYERSLSVTVKEDEANFRQALAEAAPGLKYKAALSAAYVVGLRVSEVVALKVSDIDSQRMTFRIERGKGQRMARPVCKGVCQDRQRISLLQRIRPRRVSSRP